jgi:hypothetical protein
MSSVLSTHCELVNDTMLLSLCNTTIIGNNGYFMCAPDTTMFSDLKQLRFIAGLCTPVILRPVPFGTELTALIFYRLISVCKLLLENF